MTVLITGAGLIGTQIAKLFLDQGEKTVVFDIAPQIESMKELVDVSRISIVKGDILDLAGLISAMKANQVDKVVHTAALLPGGLMKNIYSGIRVNTDGTLNVLEASRLLDVKRVIYTSTLGVYSKEGAPTEPMDEDTTSLKPLSLYGATKLMSEYACSNYSRTYALDTRIVRFANIIGPWGGIIQTGTGGFVKQLLEGAVDGKEVQIPNPPSMVLDAEWVYSVDAARGVVLLMNKNDVKSSVFNLGVGKTSKAQEIIEFIRELIPNARISIGGSDPPVVRPLRIERAKNELGWTPEYGMKSMMAEMIKWYSSKKSHSNP